MDVHLLPHLNAFLNATSAVLLVSGFVMIRRRRVETHRTLMIAALVAGGWLLSFPLDRWLDQHPLEHPYPWAARGVLLLYTALVIYAGLKLFSGRVSACAWMILAWFGIFALAMVLASRQPGR